MVVGMPRPHPHRMTPPLPAPSASVFLQGARDVRLYTAIEGPGTRGVVWFVLGPEVRAEPPYPRLFAALRAAGFATAVMHPRGSGFSDGTRGDLDDPTLLRDDDERFLARLAARFARVFLLGHSAGAATALELAAAAPPALAGLVLVNPAWKLRYAEGMGPSFRDYVVFAGNAIFRRSALSVDMNRAPQRIAFAPDRAEALAMQRDPLVVRYFSLRYLWAQRRVMKRCPRNLAASRAPLLLVHGAHDVLVDPASYAELLAIAKSPDKHELLAPEGGHGSSAVETVVEPLIAWFVAHSDCA